MHGGYSEWSDWGPCNRKCGRGTQERSRLCSSPRPANGGRDCSGLGPSRQTKTCNTQSCEGKSLILILLFLGIFVALTILQRQPFNARFSVRYSEMFLQIMLYFGESKGRV